MNLHITSQSATELELRASRKLAVIVGCMGIIALGYGILGLASFLSESQSIECFRDDDGSGQCQIERGGLEVDDLRLVLSLDEIDDVELRGSGRSTTLRFHLTDGTGVTVPVFGNTTDRAHREITTFLRDDELQSLSISRPEPRHRITNILLSLGALLVSFFFLRMVNVSTIRFSAAQNRFLVQHRGITSREIIEKSLDEIAAVGIEGEPDRSVPVFRHFVELRDGTTIPLTKKFNGPRAAYEPADLAIRTFLARAQNRSPDELRARAHPGFE